MRIDKVIKIAKEKYPDIEIYQRGGDYSSNKTSVQVIFGRTKGKIKVYHFNLITGFFSGILFTTYNLEITDIKKWDNGELITIKILERSNDYYYEK